MEIGSGDRAIRAAAAPLPAYGRCALALVVLALLFDLSSLDRSVAAYFFDPLLGDFPARRAFWAEDVLHRGGIWLVALIALAMLALLLASQRLVRRLSDFATINRTPSPASSGGGLGWGPLSTRAALRSASAPIPTFPRSRGKETSTASLLPILWVALLVHLRAYRREAGYVLACIALTTGSVALLKQSTDVDCPWDLSEYGGHNAYVHVFQAKPAGSKVEHCFPGAHSSGGFSLLAIAFVLAARRHCHARAALLASFTLGLIYAATQWARGAHFPSHDLWSAVIAWSFASWLARSMLLPQAASTRHATDGFGARAFRGRLPTGLLMLLAIGLIYPQRADAADALPIREIVFHGNEVTRPEVMLREISIAPGQPADATAIEHSRQSVQNLGLFRSVVATQEPLDDGVRVIFTVREKWYLLPYPRLSANTDGQNAIGGELRWNNIGGRNHSLRALVSSADRKEEGRGRQLSFLAKYRVPFAFGSPYTLDFSGSHATTPVESDIERIAEHDESIDEAQFLVSRKFGLKGSASQGWSAGSGLLWRHQDTSGDTAPDPYGDAYAALAQIGYKQVQDHIYSETGTRFSTRFEIADQNIGSDYSYSRLTAEFKRSIALGNLAHENFEWSAEMGSANNGPPEKQWDFSLGGTNGLRGYQRNSFQGDFYYLVSAIYLRPLHWDWLRLVAGVEAGNVYDDADELNTQVRWSFNLGLRVRVTRLVDIEFEAGIALPLDDDSGRVYGSRSGF